jgi:hypothetical protein
MLLQVKDLTLLLVLLLLLKPALKPVVLLSQKLISNLKVVKRLNVPHGLVAHLG